MLRLKRVELQGFKSFCDRSEMRFHGSGVAAVVGPNGCGKSNLSDAISWVLGEQSAKSLRGSRMEDVIFAGTRDRKSVGMASVTMTLVDPANHGESNVSAGGGHALEAKLGEITITRRLYRSGESEYLINGKQARLRDIQDIFMGSGLGPESYAIIEQGRIGQILSTKPQDRRAVIEEAAGVTRFKTKKRLSEAKLEASKSNLSRVFDILEEVSRQVNSLKRQAAKAKRLDEFRTEMVEQLRIALSGRFQMLEREAAKTVLDLNAASEQYKSLSGDVATREHEQDLLKVALYENEAKLTEARRLLAEHKVEAERVRGRLGAQAREIANIEQRLTRAEAEQEEWDQRFEQQQLELADYTSRSADLEARTQDFRRSLTLKTEERDKLNAALREREGNMESARQQVLKLLGETSILKNQLVEIDQHLVGMDRDVDRISRDEQGASADLTRLESLKSELSDRQRARQLELQDTAEQKQIVDEELATRKQRAVEVRRKLEDLRGDASRLKARRDSLEDVLSHRTYTTQSVKRLFTAAERDQVAGFKPIGVLADFLEVDPAHEKATEEFLHEELEYVLVNDWSEAERGIGFMRADMDGRATFLVHPRDGEEIGFVSQSEPAIDASAGLTGRLRDVIRFTNGLSTAPAELLPRVARCFLAADHASAQRLALQYPELYFLLPDGLCYHGHAVSGGKKTGAGPLGLKRELRETTNQYAAKQKELDRTKAMLEDLEQEISQLNEDFERLRGLQQKHEKEAVALDHDVRKMSEEFARANQRLSVARMELQRLGQERQRSAARREENERVVEGKEQARREQEEALTDARAALESLQKEAASTAEEHSALRVEVAGIEERRRAEQAARSRIEHQIGELANRKRQLASEMERLGVERARLLFDNIELDRQASLLSEQMSVGEAAVKGLAIEEADGRSKWAVSEEALKLARVEAQSASEKRSQIELTLVRKQSELGYLHETCRKELHCAIEELSPGDAAVLDEIGLADAEAKYQDLRSRIEALGPVNTQALEEFEEAQQRFDFLNAQRQDLLDSIRDIEKTIREIDAESRKRFNEAFEAININFREMFKTLFSGGVGEMRLNDEENAYDSGIDIVASPPGKKLQSVLLLSGGERALTAMALLMAIFRYQPSPFCVLDEVDAPLDEANIERLTRLIREMSSNTQFIVITHAKRTMEAAQALYGVTMQEPGVSKLVSVRFNSASASAPLLAEPERQMAAV